MFADKLSQRFLGEANTFGSSFTSHRHNTFHVDGYKGDTKEGNLIYLYCDSLKTARKTSQQITVRFYTIKNVYLCFLEFEEEGMIEDFGPWNDTRIDIMQMHDYRYVSEFRTVQGVPAKVLQYFL